MKQETHNIIFNDIKLHFSLVTTEPRIECARKSVVFFLATIGFRYLCCTNCMSDFGAGWFGLP